MGAFFRIVGFPILLGIAFFIGGAIIQEVKPDQVDLNMFCSLPIISLIFLIVPKNNSKPSNN